MQLYVVELGLRKGRSDRWQRRGKANQDDLGKKEGGGESAVGLGGGPLGITFKPVYAKSESSRVGESLLLALTCPSFVKSVIKILGKIRRKMRFLFVGDYTGVACGHQCQLMRQFSGSQGWKASQADHRQPACPPQQGRG